MSTSHMPVAATEQTAHPVPATVEKSAPGQVTGRLKRAIDLMVWEGLTRKEAAERAGMREHSLYVAFRKSHVKAHYLTECEVLRVSGRARRILRLEQLAEQDDNRNAAVAAIKAAEQLGETEEAQARRVTAPGLVIVIGSGKVATEPAGQVLDLQPIASAPPVPESGNR
jgi:hypothetical protein